MHTFSLRNTFNTLLLKYSVDNCSEVLSELFYKKKVKQTLLHVRIALDDLFDPAVICEFCRLFSISV